MINKDQDMGGGGRTMSITPAPNPANLGGSLGSNTSNAGDLMTTMMLMDRLKKADSSGSGGLLSGLLGGKGGGTGLGGGGVEGPSTAMMS